MYRFYWNPLKEEDALVEGQLLNILADLFDYTVEYDTNKRRELFALLLSSSIEESMRVTRTFYLNRCNRHKPIRYKKLVKSEAECEVFYNTYLKTFGLMQNSQDDVKVEINDFILSIDSTFIARLRKFLSNNKIEMRKE
jgi:hypothetical protein